MNDENKDNKDNKEGKCKGNVETFSRITGFYRPVQNWNQGKRSEYNDRKVYKIDEDKLK